MKIATLETTRPSFAIYRPVSGIDETHLDRMRTLLKERGRGIFGAEDVDTILRPASKLKGYILRQGELQRLYAARKLTLSEDEVLALGAHVMSNLGATAGQVITGQLLPSSLHPPTDVPRRTLIVAANQTLKLERQNAKAAIASFFELEEIPGVWFDDDYVTGVNFARSESSMQSNILNYVHGALNLRRSPMFREAALPAELGFEPVAEPDFQFFSGS